MPLGCIGHTDAYPMLAALHRDVWHLKLPNCHSVKLAHDLTASSPQNECTLIYIQSVSPSASYKALAWG